MSVGVSRGACFLAKVAKLPEVRKDGYIYSVAAGGVVQAHVEGSPVQLSLFSTGFAAGAEEEA
jgi:hypothetical protein